MLAPFTFPSRIKPLETLISSGCELGLIKLKVMIYGKYAEEKEPLVVTPPTETTERLVVPKTPVDTSGKSFPQTNELVNSYSVLGVLIFILAVMGLKRPKKIGGENNET